MSRTHHTLLIIGAGPIGLACGIEARKFGLDYLILEKGCLVNSLYHYPANMTFFSTSDRLEIGNIPFVSNNPKPTRNEALEYYRRVTSHFDLKVKLFEGVNQVKVSTDSPRFLVDTVNGRYSSDFLIVATGFYDIPYDLNVPGEDLPKVTHYYGDPHFYAFQKVAVVGANNSAVDAALEIWRKGADVTMIIRGKGIGERVKYWVKPDIENRITEGSIRAFYESEIEEILPKSIRLKTPGGLVEIENDWVIALTGYQPDLGFLERLGIELSSDSVRRPTIAEDSMETNINGIYLAGVICGGMNTHRLFIENSRVHAEKIIASIQKKLS